MTLLLLEHDLYAYLLTQILTVHTKIHVPLASKTDLTNRQHYSLPSRLSWQGNLYAMLVYFFRHFQAIFFLIPNRSHEHEGLRVPCPVPVTLPQHFRFSPSGLRRSASATFKHPAVNTNGNDRRVSRRNTEAPLLGRCQSVSGRYKFKMRLVRL